VACRGWSWSRQAQVVADAGFQGGVEAVSGKREEAPEFVVTLPPYAASCKPHFGPPTLVKSRKLGQVRTSSPAVDPGRCDLGPPKVEMLY